MGHYFIHLKVETILKPGGKKKDTGAGVAEVILWDDNEWLTLSGPLLFHLYSEDDL